MQHHQTSSHTSPQAPQSVAEHPPSGHITTSYHHLDPKAVWLFFINSTLGWFIFLLSIGSWFVFFIIYMMEVLELERSVSFVLLLGFLLSIPAIIILIWVWAKLAYRYYRYQLSEDGFKKELGVIYKKYVTIPYDRIQNVDIYRGILDRMLGLSELNIQTAGYSATMGRHGVRGAGAEGRLPGLSSEAAEQLRDELIRRAKRTKDQGL